MNKPTHAVRYKTNGTVKTNHTPTNAIVDLDYVKYSVASVGEERSILVTHKPSGRTNEYKTRTEFWGRTKKIDPESKLGEINAKRTSPFTKDEFEIEDVQKERPIAHTLHSVKMQIEGVLKDSGAKSWEGVIGEGDSFRKQLSTLEEYKGARADLIKPLQLEQVIDFLKSKYNPTIVTDIEADDWCVMRCFKQPNNFIIGNDKDYLGCPVNYFDANNREAGIQNCNQFGSLWRKDKTVKGELKKGAGDPTGIGRMFFWYQVCSEDNIDCYHAHLHSDTPWGKVSAYDALKDCSNDKEAAQTVVNIFHQLYPEPKEITTWKGDIITIDARYVFNEMVSMARMLRFEGEKLSGDDILKKLKVKF